MVMRCLCCALLGSALLLSGCDEAEEAETESPLRAVKYLTLDTRAGQQERRIAGVVAASITSNVAFEINGQVIELLRDPGDRIAGGELIARLDPEPYQIQLDQAQASLDQALASVDDARSKFEQQSRLREQGFATQTAFDSAKATLGNAEGAVRVARSQLDLARRDLEKTSLSAPFDGVIALKQVEVFEEISTGQAIYAVQSEAEAKIEASLPETLINVVSLGDPVGVSFPPLGGATTTGSVDEISPLTGDVNSYPVEVAIDVAPPGLRPGMSAELVFRFDADSTGTAFVVPLSAVLPQTEGQDASVFVYDPATSKLSARPVTVVNVRGNNLQIVGELQDGEVLAAAGLSFLHDGMEVTLFDPDLLD